jgi:ABC-type polysaccharide/polyol phosphate export permease
MLKTQHLNGLRIILAYLKAILRQRNLLLQLIVRDFKSKYLGSYLGFLWAFVQPLVTIFILWFVFQIGFKSMPVENCPFILWLVTGMIPWFFFADSCSTTSQSIVEYNYLVKKIAFDVSLLPLVKLISALMIHFFFLFVLIFIYLVFDYPLSIHALQVIYYLGALLALLLGGAYLNSSIIVFFKDIGQLIAMGLQLGFWGTPIFWSLNMIPEKYHYIIKLNPVFYIINGYREALIYKKWFWESAGLMCYYWVFTALLLIVGIIVFRKLKPHLADVL